MVRGAARTEHVPLPTSGDENCRLQKAGLRPITTSASLNDTRSPASVTFVIFPLSLLQLFPALGHGLRQATRDHRQLPPHSNSLQQRYCSSFDLGKGQIDVVRHLAPFPFTGGDSVMED
ncbi:cardiac phospholamban isoform X2 [Lagopus leucura]|uniref:cardiac phospholamban isoform X2 n=1 Tax=Lagopus leucura TaxID=30410 RepID=UPI001C6782F9|nr:cardiac phospholamban isoform X2 [Lagopus leucura]